MLTDKFLELLKYEGEVALTSWGSSEEGAPHMTGTWISYLTLTEYGRLLAPAAGFSHFEADIKVNDTVLALVAVREVTGFNDYQGIGFRLTAKAKLLNDGADYETVKSKFPWCRQALELTPVKLEQLL
ncbi:MAG: pyridoxamine 5'-phosphate oxidase family protein [Streptococcaceae bacterium]|nr:pyridoxamine 5'-phosphate oxidase family protein [Streptococcaceae bacterium]